MSTILQDVLDEVYAALAADADFLAAGGSGMVDFIVEDKGDVETQIGKALAQGTGLACVMDLVEGVDEAPDAPAAVLNPLTVVMEVSERVVVNRQGTAGQDYLTLRQLLAMLIAKTKNFTYSSGAALVFARFRMVPPPKGADAAYQLFFETAETIRETIPAP